VNSLILTTAARAVSVLMAAFSIYLLLRGHNNPGGGFLGGLVAAAAVLVWAIATDVHRARARLRLDPIRIAAAGALVAITAGLLGLLQSQPFLAALWVFPFGLPLGTPLLFDLGVYLVVFGAVTALALALEEEA
jgi:multisubunit Na+/H+ antiporter MnhB subunit